MLANDQCIDGLKRNVNLQRTTTYREQSRMYLAQAYEELAKGDLEQASEKGWGAAAQIIKAVAKQRGWPHNSHHALRRAVTSLIEETGDSELGSLFGSAGDLHINFYEHWNTVKLTAIHLGDVERLVEMLEGMLDGKNQG